LLSILSDSYMGIFLPQEIPSRIMQFMSSKIEFPFIQSDETVGIFFLFGKEFGSRQEAQIRATTDLARRTVEQIARNIRLYRSMPSKLDSRYIRENYTKRSLQIVIECQPRGLIEGSEQSQKAASTGPNQINRRISSDPEILSECYAQHIAHYRQDYFFELFQPFRKEKLPPLLQTRLEGRMLMLGFNVKSAEMLPFVGPLEPFFMWLQSQQRV